MWISPEVAGKILGFRRDGIEALTEVARGPLKLAWRPSRDGPQFDSVAVAEPVDVGGERLAERSRPSARGRRKPKASDVRQIVESREN